MENFISISIQEKQFKYTYNDINSSFLIQHDIIPIDLISKISADISKDKQTYISLLHNLTSEKINLYSDIGYKTVQLNSTNTISMSTETHKNLLDKYSKINCDAIFSPYHILINHIQQEKLYFQLNLFLIDNKLYAIITDTNYKVIYNNVSLLSTIEEIEQSKFFIDSISEQQLFQEIYQLEIEQSVKLFLKEYKLVNNATNIKNINLFYSLKTVSTEAQHHKINISSSIQQLTQDELIKGDKSYKSMKDKKSTNMILKLSIAIIMVLIIIYTMLPINNILNEPIIKQQPTVSIKKEITKDIAFNTQDHIKINNDKISTIKQILNTITYDTIINKISINHDNSTMLITNLYPDTFIKNLEPNIKKIYENSKLSSQEMKENIYYSEIYNNELIKNKHRIKPQVKSYTKQSRAKKQIEDLVLSLMPQDSKIDLINKNHDTYNFKLHIQLKNPNQFYELIKKISLQENAINVQYPIIITNQQSYLDIIFNLKYQQ